MIVALAELISLMIIPIVMMMTTITRTIPAVVTK